MRFQRDPMLINVHLLNLPLAAAEHLANPRMLTPHDLWLTVASALAYFGLYMGVLDANGACCHHRSLSHSLLPSLAASLAPSHCHTTSEPLSRSTTERVPLLSAVALWCQGCISTSSSRRARLSSPWW